MNPAIAIFVKTPGLSPVKTRLGASHGSGAAEAWHRLASACVQATAGATGLPTYWAVAEAEGMDHEMWQALPRLAQGEGGLGRRMATVHGELVRRHGAGILIGADLPQIETRHLHAAARWLIADEPRHVMGPARDGGFWLFGANRSPAVKIWESVRYSRDDTAREFIKAVNAAAWEMLEPLTDLDQAGDLPTVLRELEAVARPTECQLELARWLERRIEQAA
ncbi:MAG: DUF2064 domain-containing protein [Wenzhouxiangellaceae bacterium]